MLMPLFLEGPETPIFGRDVALSPPLVERFPMFLEFTLGTPLIRVFWVLGRVAN